MHTEPTPQIYIKYLKDGRFIRVPHYKPFSSVREALALAEEAAIGFVGGHTLSIAGKAYRWNRGELKRWKDLDDQLDFDAIYMPGWWDDVPYLPAQSERGEG